MQAQTPLGEALLLELNKQLINVSEPSANKINLCFDQLSENLRHQVNNHELSKINYKTVVASMKGQHPNILKAQLQKNADELYVMTITVSYEFLPQIQEQIIFSKREIKPEESQEIAVRNMKNYLRNIRQQIKSMTNIQVFSGEIQYMGGNTSEVYIPLPHSKNLITWTLKLKPSGNMLKAQLYYYNSTTRNKQNSKILPDEGVFLYYANTNQCNTELRFAVEQSDKYDNALLVIQGKHQGEYVVSLEKVTYD